MTHRGQEGIHGGVGRLCRMTGGHELILQGGKTLVGFTKLRSLQNQAHVEHLAFFESDIPGLQHKEIVNKGVLQWEVINLQAKGLQILDLNHPWCSNAKQQLLFHQRADLALQLQRSRASFQDHQQVGGSLQAFEAQWSIRAPEQKMIIQRFSQQGGTSRVNAAKDGPGSLDPEAIIENEMQGKQPVEVLVRQLNRRIHQRHPLVILDSWLHPLPCR